MSASPFRCLAIALLLLGSLGFLPTAQTPAAAAATFTVNSNLDTPDQVPGDGFCNDGSGKCTLRAAIMETNVLNSSDTILFAQAYTINISAPLPAINDPTGGTIIKRVGERVSLVGTSAGPETNGLTIQSSNNKIQNLNILNFDGNGIQINGNNNIIGMDSDGVNDAQEQNQIHSNTGNGIMVVGSNNRVAGNILGLNGSPNKNGIEIAGGTGTLIGTNGDGFSDSMEGNTIAYNNQNGIFDHGPSTVIAGNTVINNSMDGILISLANGARIGTNGNGISDGFESNRVSGNHLNGIKLYDADNVTIAGNKIGVNEAGTAVHFNYDYGIYVDTSNSTLIGTDGSGVGAAVEGNLISGNMDGQIYALNTLNTVIAGNKIGTDLSGNASIPSAQGFGIKLENPNSLRVSISTIGTNNDGNGDALEGNLISGNKSDGIQIWSSDSNTIRGNIIGLNASGANALPNGANGVLLVNNSSQNNILYNLISGNTENGVFLNNGAVNNRVRGNKIGTNQEGRLAVANLLNGVLIRNSWLNVIGTNPTGSIADPESNLISGNGANGIKLEGTAANTDRNGIYGNRIGTTIDGIFPVPNAISGVFIAEGTYLLSNYIQGNLIAYHPSFAVRLEGNQTNSGNLIIGNSMIQNYGGISINGAFVNDILDGDGGPNERQNYPVLQLAELSGNSVVVSLNINSTAATNFNLALYLTRGCTDYQSDYNQGEFYLGQYPVTTDPSGNFLGGASVDLPQNYLGKGRYLLATITNTVGTTSEFSNCILVEGLYRDIYLPTILR